MEKSPINSGAVDKRRVCLQLPKAREEADEHGGDLVQMRGTTLPMDNIAVQIRLFVLNVLVLFQLVAQQQDCLPCCSNKEKNPKKERKNLGYFQCSCRYGGPVISCQQALEFPHHFFRQRYPTFCFFCFSRP